MTSENVQQADVAAVIVLGQLGQLEGELLVARCSGVVPRANGSAEQLLNRSPCSTTTPAKTTDTIAINLIRMFKAGPEVSLKGSPTVSPTTPALWDSEPLPPKWPSMYFLALSQAPPAFAM